MLCVKCSLNFHQIFDNFCDFFKIRILQHSCAFFNILWTSVNSCRITTNYCRFLRIYFYELKFVLFPQLYTQLIHAKHLKWICLNIIKYNLWMRFYDSKEWIGLIFTLIHKNLFLRKSPFIFLLLLKRFILSILLLVEVLMIAFVTIEMIFFISSIHGFVQILASYSLSSFQFYVIENGIDIVKVNHHSYRHHDDFLIFFRFIIYSMWWRLCVVNRKHRISISYTMALYIFRFSPSIKCSMCKYLHLDLVASQLINQCTVLVIWIESVEWLKTI